MLHMCIFNIHKIPVFCDKVFMTKIAYSLWIGMSYYKVLQKGKGLPMLSGTSLMFGKLLFFSSTSSFALFPKWLCWRPENENETSISIRVRIDIHIKEPNLIFYTFCVTICAKFSPTMTVKIHQKMKMGYYLLSFASVSAYFPTC